MMGFVSIDNRPEFFIDLLNSSYLNDTFMYNVTNVSSNSIDANEEEEANTIEFVLMSLVTVLLGLLILITIIGESHRRHSAQYVLLILSSFFFFSFSGNVFVIIAVLIEKHLQNSGNYLVASLAVADLLVACLGEIQSNLFYLNWLIIHEPFLPLTCSHADGRWKSFWFLLKAFRLIFILPFQLFMRFNFKIGSWDRNFARFGRRLMFYCEIDDLPRKEIYFSTLIVI